MDPSLVDASERGDLPFLQQLLTEDPLSLDRIQIGCLIQTPLHIAAFHGHLSFVEEILRRCPSLSLVLDLRRRSALHLAASQGHGKVVSVLARDSPEMCGVLDGDGKNPFHLAAIKGWENVLAELVQTGTHAARDRTAAGENILELCVKYDRIDCLKFLSEKIRDPEFVNGKDGDENNVFHQAVKYKRIQMIKYLITQQIKVNINATNATGLTPLDILLQENNANDLEIRDILRQAGAIKKDEILSSTAAKNDSNNNNNNMSGNTDWFIRRRGSMFMVAPLITAMAFNAGLTPPGGLWQNHLSNQHKFPHRAGEAIMAYNYPFLYKMYIRSNTTAYVSSLSIILLEISGLPLKNRGCMWALQVVMWVTITAMAFTYSHVLWAITPEKHMRWLRRTLVAAVLVWCIVMALVFIGNGVRLVLNCVKRKGRRTSQEHIA